MNNHGIITRLRSRKHHDSCTRASTRLRPPTLSSTNSKPGHTTGRVTDIIKFRIGTGKILTFYPVIDCFDGTHVT